MEEERLQILKMVAAGQIGAEEAARLLEAIEPEELQADEEVSPPDGEPARSDDRWANYWLYPLMGGAGVLILGALVVDLVYTVDAARGWLVCGWLPMVLGTMVIVLAWWSRRARWLHLRIHEPGKRRLAVSLPLPWAWQPGGCASPSRSSRNYARPAWTI